MNFPIWTSTSVYFQFRLTLTEKFYSLKIPNFLKILFCVFDINSHLVVSGTSSFIQEIVHRSKRTSFFLCCRLIIAELGYPWNFELNYIGTIKKKMSIFSKWYVSMSLCLWERERNRYNELSIKILIKILFVSFDNQYSIKTVRRERFPQIFFSG